jgi:peroxiredoxin/outer membrane lipoprotein-sorting protein
MGLVPKHQRRWFAIFVLLVSLLVGARRTLSSASETGETDHVDRVQAEGLLKRVGETYRSLKNYRFELELLTEIRSQAVNKTLESQIDLSISRPDKSRLLTSGALGELHAFSDGSQRWVFFPEMKQYRRENAAHGSADPPTRDKAGAMVRMATDVIARYEELGKEHSPTRLLRQEPVTVGDKIIECQVVEVQGMEGDSDQKTMRTYWIDPSSALILRSLQSTEIQGEEGAVLSRLTTRVRQMDVEKEFPADWFKFVPPADAVEVEQFRMLRATGSDLLGSEAADFTLKDLNDTQIHLKSLRGRTVLLNFWATWCGPCRLELPVIERLHHEFKGKGLEVFGINDEELDTIREYLADNEYTFPTLLDSDQRVSTLYRVRGIPTMVLINRDGVVAHYRIGLSQEQDLRNWLKQEGIE